jgi:hypothetical protein
MKIELSVDPEQLRQLIGEAVRAYIEQAGAGGFQQDGRLAFTEEEAAEKLGLAEHVLRDERLRGRIKASKIVGARIRYTLLDLQAYLEGRPYVPKGQARSRPGPATTAGD